MVSVCSAAITTGCWVYAIAVPEIFVRLSDPTNTLTILDPRTQ